MQQEILLVPAVSSSRLCSLFDLRNRGAALELGWNLYL
jgi:hypothetical protein